MDDRDLLIALRQGLLLMVDALERKLEIEPRTAAMRQASKPRGPQVWPGEPASDPISQFGRTVWDTFSTQ
jgi:hypothetical protein